MLCNIIYALLAERMDAQDRIATPVMLSVGSDPKEVERLNQRDALDGWLSAPTADQAAADQALIAFLTG